MTDFAERITPKELAFQSQLTIPYHNIPYLWIPFILQLGFVASLNHLRILFWVTPLFDAFLLHSCQILLWQPASFYEWANKEEMIYGISNFSCLFHNNLHCHICGFSYTMRAWVPKLSVGVGHKSTDHQQLGNASKHHGCTNSNNKNKTAAFTDLLMVIIDDSSIYLCNLETSMTHKPHAFLKPTSLNCILMVTML